MRCGRARRWMAAAAAGELAPRRRQALDGHLEGCASCRVEMARTERLLGALDRLGGDAPVPSSLEHATIRRVRAVAAEEAEARSRRRSWLGVATPAFALATAAGVALVVGRLGTGPEPAPPVPAARTARAPVAAEPAAPVVAKREAPAPASTAGRAPAEPPPELAAAPDLFMDLPILRNLDKLKNFESIRTTTLDDSPSLGDAREEQSG